MRDSNLAAWLKLKEEWETSLLRVTFVLKRQELVLRKAGVDV